MYRRIFISAVTGSGKTTLAAELARRTGLPWYSVDNLTWEPGWVSIPDDEQRARIEPICAKDEWILDTAYGSWLDIPLSTADLIIALDYPRWLSLARLIRRTARRVITKEEFCNGNMESLHSIFGSNSVILWHFRSFPREKQRLRQLQTDPSRPDVLRFRWPRQTRRWLQSVTS